MDEGDDIDIDKALEANLDPREKFRNPSFTRKEQQNRVTKRVSDPMIVTMTDDFNKAIDRTRTYSKPSNLELFEEEKKED